MRHVSPATIQHLLCFSPEPQGHFSLDFVFFFFGGMMDSMLPTLRQRVDVSILFIKSKMTPMPTTSTRIVVPK